LTGCEPALGAGEPKAALAREFGISRETVYQYLRAADT
jgi:DNA-binding CsgD family transcriptional regulator